MTWLPLIALVVAGLALVLRQQVQNMTGIDEETFATLLVGGALAAFIGTSMLASYRGRYGTALKHGVVSAVIGFGLVTGFRYKAEVSQFALRMTEEFMPQGHYQVIEPSQAGQKAVRIHRRHDGHFAARMQLNGFAVTMLVDTGASAIVLSASDAGAVGVDPKRLSFSVPVQTANGIAYCAAMRLREVSIGPITLRDVDALVAKPGVLRESLLGISFLRQLRAYEFSRDFLILRG